MEEDTVWECMVDLLLGVNHLHEHDLVHMDIKPENIFIGMKFPFLTTSHLFYWIAMNQRYGNEILWSLNNNFIRDGWDL